MSVPSLFIAGNNPRDGTALPYEDKDIKLEVQELEHLERDELSGNIEPTVSRYAELSRGRTVKTFWKAIMFALMASFGATSDGFQLSTMGGIIVNQGFIDTFGRVGPDGKIALVTSHISAWGGVYSAGQILAVFMGGISADRFGRKFNLYVMIVLLLLGNVLEIVAKEWKVWLAAKLFVGMGTGLATTVTVVYVTEVAPAQIRGGLIATWALANAFGQITSAIALQVLATSSVKNEYKRALYSQFVFSGLTTVFALIMPETPWWYAQKGRHENAVKALRRFNGNIKGYDAEYEYSILREEIEASVRLAELAKQSKWTELFTGVNGRRSLVSGSVTVFAQIAGGALVFNYLTYFFQLAGLDNPFLANLIVFIILIVFIAISFFTTEVIGRRPLMIGGAIVIIGTLFGIGGAGTVARTTGVKNALIALACIWVAAYASFVSPLAVVFSGEIATPRLRSKTNALGQGAAQLFGLIFNYSVPYMLEAWNVKTAFFFGCTASIGFAILYFILPETKGRSFAEIDELFLAKVPARKFKEYETAEDRLKKSAA